MSKNQLIDKIHRGCVSVTLWEHIFSEGESHHSLTVEHLDPEGKPQNATSFSKGELLLLAKALHAAYESVSRFARQRE